MRIHFLPRKSSLKHNVIVNYVAQAFLGVITIVMAPIYLYFMGQEAYGLIGFFTTLSIWFQILDMGLTPTVAREMARFQGGGIKGSDLRAYLRALEIVFYIVAILGGVFLVLFSSEIATKWLHPKHLSVSDVTWSVALMGLSVPARWIAGLYRGVITGLEQQVWLGGFNIVINALRFVGIIGVFYAIGTSPVDFFAYQFIIALIEMVGLLAVTYVWIYNTLGRGGKFSWQPFRQNINFSAFIALTSTISLVVTQADKLILSKTLTLIEYGAFSLASVAAGALNSASIPFGQALLPRLTSLVSKNDSQGATQLYSNSTQAVSALIAPVLVMFSIFSEQILFVWTGNRELARHIAPVLCLYAIGNSWAAMGALPYYIQYAKGNLRLQFIGTAVMMAILLPAFLWAAPRYGALGTAVVWATVNGLYSLLWVPVIHSRFYKGEHWRWIFRDILPMVAATVLVGSVLAMVVPQSGERVPTAAVLLIVCILLFATSIMTSTYLRPKFANACARLVPRNIWNLSKK